MKRMWFAVQSGCSSVRSGQKDAHTNAKRKNAIKNVKGRFWRQKLKEYNTGRSQFVTELTTEPA